ncbi:cation:proton antiporter [Paraliomyxa miuraensis]|uniref:cation:proton antiporter n=1 Tax=Paraliomyxa miuraensis TaxID=376150 RepID=UPI00225C0C6B|nr:cation:proton antiporter [Paraliomyxa miuraensis]MCX4246906.1 cation:proton antiporter [Paraliomyxa miuraensis]
MRRLFVVLVLLVMMVGLQELQTQAAAPGTDPLTLAAIGFVVLAAFALAELGGRLTLPKVTGYIVTGIVFGPYAADILSKQVVTDMRMFNDLAIGLIATSAGLELDAKGIARKWRSLSATVGLKVGLLPIAVGGTFVALQLVWAPLPLDTFGATLGMAIMFSALAVGTSPSIALAVLSETGAKGPMADLTLGLAVLKDAVVVVCLAVATAVTMSLLDPNASLDAGVLINVGLHLGEEIALGVALAGLLYLYMRFLGAEMLLFVAAMILVVTHVSDLLHMEPLLTFIVAGFIVRNFTKYEHTLLHPLEMVALPVFVVFFTNAGAGVDLGATIEILPFALALCAARALTFYAAGRFGAAAGGESPTVQRVAWMAYLPQAGVTLGLVGIAANQVSPLSDQIKTLGMAIVAINLLAGPITLRMALKAAGEIGDPSPTPTTSGSSERRSEVPDAIRELPDELESPELRELLGRLRIDLQRPWAEWRNEELCPSTRRWSNSLCVPADARAVEHGAALVQRGLERVVLEDVRDRSAGLRKVLAQLLEHLEELPISAAVPLEERNARAQATDPWRVRWSKRMSTVGAVLSGRGDRRIRKVPVRITARAVIEPAMARAAEESLRDWQRFEIECLEVLERTALGTAASNALTTELQERERLLLEKVASNHEATLWAAVRELGRQLADLGAPGERRLPRYSAVERELEACLRRLDDDVTAWPARRRAAVERLRFTAQSELVEHRVCARLQQEVLGPLDVAFTRASELVADQLRRLDSLPRSTALTDADAWSRAEAQVRAVLPKPVVKELRTLGTKVRRATSGDAAGVELRAFMAEGEEKITVVPSLGLLAEAPRPAQVEIVTIDARELEEVQLAGRMLPLMDECLSDAAVAFSAIRDQMREVESLAEFGLDSARRSVDDGGPATSLDEALDRGHAMLEALQVGACQGWEAARPRLMDAVTGMAEQLSDLVTATAGGDHGKATTRVDRFTRLRLRAQRLRDQVVGGLRRLIRTLRTGEVGQAAEDLALRYRLRAGLQRLDALAIRSFLDDQRALRKTRLTGLPGSLFTVEPLRDPRLFVANRDALSTIVRAERAWQSQPSSGNAVLVIAPSGTGKSSTIGIAQLKLGTRRVVSVRSFESEGTTLRGALARALGVPDDDAAVLASLRAAPAAVVVDDLQQFFPPSAEGLAALESFIALVVASQEHTFWLLAMAEESMLAWQNLVPLDDAFPCRVHLQPIEPAQLTEILEARRELGGQRCEFPAPRGLGKLLRRSPQETYVRRLAVASAGNLRRAMALFRAHAEPEGELLRLRTLASLSWRLPFVQQLREETQAILTLLVRHERLGRPVLAQALGASEEEIEVHLRFLLASGLVELSAGTYGITELVVDDVVLSLRESGAVGGIDR